jgi:hypothetical protein
MSTVEVCRDCGKLFGFLARGICGDCIDARELQFVVVKEWLRENPGASLAAAVAATGVPEPRMAEFIREGRLELAGAGPSPEEKRLEEELRARLVREIASRPVMGTSVSAAAGEPEAPHRRPGGGMRTRG